MAEKKEIEDYIFPLVFWHSCMATYQALNESLTPENCKKFESQLLDEQARLRVMGFLYSEYLRNPDTIPDFSLLGYGVDFIETFALYGTVDKKVLLEIMPEIEKEAAKAELLLEAARPYFRIKENTDEEGAPLALLVCRHAKSTLYVLDHFSDDEGRGKICPDTRKILEKLIFDGKDPNPSKMMKPR